MLLWVVVTMLSDEQLSTAYWGARVVVPMYRQGLGDYRQHTHAAGLRAVESAVRADTLREVAEQAGKTEAPANGLLDEVAETAYARGRADMQREVQTVEWEYGVEDNVAEGGVEEGYTTAESAQRMADFRNRQYKKPEYRSWVVRRTYWEAVTPAETPSPVAEMFPGTRTALDALSIRTPSTPNQQGAEQK